MNVADSRRVSSALEKLGYQSTTQTEEADVIVLNTCVVRQSAENKAYGRLTSLRPLKEKRPDLTINLMGCLVGVKGNPKLAKTFPYVDVFSPPSDPGPLVDHLLSLDGLKLEAANTTLRNAIMDEEIVLPNSDQGQLVSANVPIVLGCSHACTFCIIPFRRGIERSRAVGAIAQEIRSLSDQGVREVTLLGQIVDRYGTDIENGPNLVDLLKVIQDIDGIWRIRFLTSHPLWMTDELIDAVAELPKVCEHFEVPVQSGDDQVLERMKRGYTVDDYRKMIHRIRDRVPGAMIATDIIVGFPGETEEEFMHTYSLMEEIRFDVVHLARYSPRPHTVSARRMQDDVSEHEKMARFRALEELQSGVSAELNAEYSGNVVEVLVDGMKHDRWKGRTRTNKLVFFESSENLLGQLIPVEIHSTGPWSMRGHLPLTDLTITASPERILSSN